MFCPIRQIAVAFSITFSSAVFAQDYKTPAGVDIFSQSEVLEEFVGNSVLNKAYFEYYEPSADNHNEGQLRGKSERYGLYHGSWKIVDARICLTYTMRLMSSLGNCYTVARVGEETRIYRKDGYEMYPDGGRLSVVKGNPGNL